MKYCSRLMVFCCMMMVSITSFCQNKIDKSKAEVKQGNPKSNTSGTAAHSTSSSKNDDGEKSLGEIIGEGILKGIMYLTFYSTIGDYKRELHLHSNTTPYPYYDRQSGNYESTNAAVIKNHFRADVAYRFLLSNNNVTGQHIKLNVRPFQYFYLQAASHWLTQRNTNGINSNLQLYHVNFAYDRIRLQKFNFGWKLGICYIANEVKAGGFSGGLDAEGFLIKPLSIYVSSQWGAINRVAVNESEIACKLYLKRYHLDMGYEHLRIGSPNYNCVFLGAGIHL